MDAARLRVLAEDAGDLPDDGPPRRDERPAARRADEPPVATRRDAHLSRSLDGEPLPGVLDTGGGLDRDEHVGRGSRLRIRHPQAGPQSENRQHQPLPSTTHTSSLPISVAIVPKFACECQIATFLRHKTKGSFASNPHFAERQHLRARRFGEDAQEADALRVERGGSRPALDLPRASPVPAVRRDLDEAGGEPAASFARPRQDNHAPRDGRGELGHPPVAPRHGGPRDVAGRVQSVRRAVGSVRVVRAGDARRADGLRRRRGGLRPSSVRPLQEHPVPRRVLAPRLAPCVVSPVGERRAAEVPSARTDDPLHLANRPLRTLRPIGRLVVEQPVVAWLLGGNAERGLDAGDGHRRRESPGVAAREFECGDASPRESRQVQSVRIHGRSLQRGDDRVHRVAGQVRERTRPDGKGVADLPALRQHRGEDVAGIPPLEVGGCHLLEDDGLVELTDEVRPVLSRPAEVDDHRDGVVDATRAEEEIGERIRRPAVGHQPAVRVRRERIAVKPASRHPEPRHLLPQFECRGVGRKPSRIAVARTDTWVSTICA